MTYKIQDENIGIVEYKKCGKNIFDVNHNIEKENREMETVVIEKSLDYLKNILNMDFVILRFSKMDDENIDLFKKIGFVYEKENSKNAFYRMVF